MEIKNLNERIFLEGAHVLPEYAHEADGEISRFLAIGEIKNGFYKDSNDTIFHFKNSFPHREDGPAIIFSNGDEEWWLNGILVTKEEVLKCSLDNSISKSNNKIKVKI